MPSTIRDLTELTAVAVDDYFVVSDTSDVTNRDKRISQTNLIGFPAADISRLSVAQSFSALKTFGAGLAFGSSPQTTLSYFGEGAWTPVVRDATSGGNVATAASATGRYARVGSLVYASCNLQNVNIGGLTTTNVLYITGLPFPSRNVANYIAHAIVQTGFWTFTNQLQAVIPGPALSYCYIQENVTNNNAVAKLVSAIISINSDLIFEMVYITD
jgi:hypothetical protein